MARKVEQITIYDVNQDVNRPVTQEDVDRLVAIANAYGTMRRAVVEAAEVSNTLTGGLYSRGR